MEMESLDRHSSLTIVLNKISDLLLTDTFDLDSGSNRLQVESGEIYYILSGPLKLLDLTENLQDYLGLNAEGNTARPNISDEQFFALERLLDPMNILKIYAIGDVTGGNSELAKYTTAFDEMIQAPAENLEKLIAIENELRNILIETKNMQMPRSISILKAAKSVNAPTVISPPKQVTQEIKPEEIKPEEIKPQEMQNTTIELQQPTALKPPSTFQTGIVEATPLTKPEKLERIKESAPKPNIIKKEITTMKDLEKDSLNTDSWINTEKSEESVVSKPPEQVIQTKQIVPKVAPITPKSKPVVPKIEPVPQIQSNIENNIPKETIQPRINDNQNNLQTEKSGTLPKPKQRFSPIPKPNTNGIVRTFPNGNICKGCGVSMSNSWRYCPLCGFNF